jgi:hypothetical protein
MILQPQLFLCSEHSTPPDFACRDECNNISLRKQRRDMARQNITNEDGRVGCDALEHPVAVPVAQQTLWVV